MNWIWVSISFTLYSAVRQPVRLLQQPYITSIGVNPRANGHDWSGSKQFFFLGWWYSSDWRHPKGGKRLHNNYPRHKQTKHVHWISSFRQNSLSGSFQLKVWDKNWKIEPLGLGSLHKFGILGEKINDRQNSIAHNPNIKMVPWPKYSRDIICQWDFIRNSKHIFSKHAVVFHDTVYSLLLLEVTQKSITALKNRPMK